MFALITGIPINFIVIIKKKILTGCLAVGNRPVQRVVVEESTQGKLVDIVTKLLQLES